MDEMSCLETAVPVVCNDAVLSSSESGDGVEGEKSWLWVAAVTAAVVIVIAIVTFFVYHLQRRCVSEQDARDQHHSKRSKRKHPIQWPRPWVVMAKRSSHRAAQRRRMFRRHRTRVWALRRPDEFPAAEEDIPQVENETLDSASSIISDVSNEIIPLLSQTDSAMDTDQKDAEPAVVHLGRSKTRVVVSDDGDTSHLESIAVPPITPPSRSRQKSARVMLQTSDVSTIPLFQYADEDALSQSTRKPTTRLLLSVAINYVTQPDNELETCWNDVRAIHSALAQRAGRPFDTVWHLTDERGILATGTSESKQPTKAEFAKAVEEFIGKAKEAHKAGDKVEACFVYSGHGYYRWTKDPTELSGKAECIVLQDGPVWDSEIMTKLVRGMPDGSSLLLCFDSCNSGSAANLPFTYNVLSDSLDRTSLEDNLTTQVVMFAACRDEQIANSGATNQDLSAFSTAFVRELQEAPLGERATAMWHRIRSTLASSRDPQTPVLSMSHEQLLGASL